MGEQSLFISSCSRRDLARRRPPRAGRYLPFVLGAMLLAAAVALVLVFVAGV
jgi:hypothetical protein